MKTKSGLPLTIEQIKSGSIRLASMGASLKELKEFDYKMEYPDNINDHAADAFRYAMINGVFMKRDKKPNRWLIVLAILAAIIVLAISVMAIL